MKLVKYTFLFFTASIVSSCVAARPQQPRRIEIQVRRFAYTPDKITLKKNETVVLVFRTTDVTHGIKIAELNVRADIKKGTDTEITVTPAKVGHFIGECSHFCGSGHGSMILQIDVTE